MTFIDTNYFLRLFIDDASQQHINVSAFFLKASVHDDLYMTSSLVVFEVYWVLKRFYKVEKMRLIEAVDKILKMNFIEIADRLVILKALSLYADSSLEFEDCFHLEFAHAAHCKDIATFDKKLSRAFKGEIT